MWTFLSHILDKLKDQEVFSSFFPLLVLIIILVVGTVVFLIKALLFAHGKKLHPSDRKMWYYRARRDTEVASRNRSRLRYFFSRVFVSEKNQPANVAALLEEINRLRKKVEQAEAESIQSRDQYAQTLKKLEEVKAELELAKDQQLIEHKTLMAAHATRTRFLQHSELMQTQIMLLFKEVERLAATNSPELQEIVEKMRQLLQSFNVDTSRAEGHLVSVMNSQETSGKDEEIQRLKGLLLLCREKLKNSRMVALSFSILLGSPYFLCNFNLDDKVVQPITGNTCHERT